MKTLRCNIFFIFLLCLTTCKIGGDVGGAGHVLHVAFPYNRAVIEYDPLRIHLAPEYIFLENIYSTLVEISPKGEIVPAVAKRFEWIGDDAVFKIRKNLKTVDGIPITAFDAAFSLKRMLIKGAGSYGHILDMLCQGKAITSIKDDCTGIAVKGNNLILRPKSKKSFLFPMLASIDFAVIPHGSVDSDTLDIRDYRNTSGAYYVGQDYGNGHIELKANKNHFHYSKKIASKIIMVPTDVSDSMSSLKYFENGQVDLLTTVDSTRPEDVISFARKHSNANLHMTLNIRTMTISFTQKGILETTAEQRRSIGNSVRTAFTSYIKKNHIEGYESTDQYFSVFGEAGLKLNELDLLHRMFQDKSDHKIPLGLKIQVVRVGDIKLWQKILSPVLPGINIELGSDLPAFTTYSRDDDIPHFIITGPDTGWMEDIGLISYTVNAEYFGITREQGKIWLEKYTRQEDKKERLRMLREIHFQALRNAVLIPFAGVPYVAVVRKPWKINLSTFFANNQFWLFTWDQDS